MKKLIVGIIILFLGAGLGWWLAVDMAYLQLAAMPIILFIFTKLVPLPFRISLKAATTVFILSAAGVAISYNLDSFRSGGILIARLADDSLENQSRIFRNQVSAITKKLGLSSEVVRHPTPIRGKNGARKLLQSQRRLAVVWGNSKVISAVFPAQQNASLEDLVGNQVNNLGIPELGQLYVVRSVDFVSVASQQGSPIDVFLGYLVAAQAASSPIHRVGFLLQALSVQGKWKWFDHFALPNFIYGTELLLASVNDGVFEPGELECAEQYLKWATTLLAVPKSDRQLRAAAINNHGIVSYLKAHLVGDSKFEGKYLKEFEAASKLRERGKDLQLGGSIKLSAKSNLKTVTR